ncbi:hypothetical protein [Tenacibaculum caenipelagi]|uniref:DoxX-like protein n=1 Tax=Tenacibaculum caenipelagi TaxID=1325435 RepID=A0A4R6TIH7_9FLAO|nr:hypothetical protein [Tenacibaculum caenipelagi]TDQ28552.1 hypothetical protein DFQ07_0928 [Tenacibaculum caenipelagi]
MNNKTLLQFLKISSFFIFFGRAYQHLFWDAPYRSFFWDQKLLEPIINFVFDTTWQSYVTNLNTDYAIQILTRSIGILYVICAVISIAINENSKKWMGNVLTLGAVSLIFLALMITKDKFYHLIMFFEHTIQFGVPVALLYFLKDKNTSLLVFYLKIFIALTFTCHGMYAIGVFYPLPGDFVTMTLNILPIQEEMAKNLLFLAGILDFVIAIAIFIPKFSRPVLVYACFWGFITAFARIISGLHYDISLSIVHQYTYLMIYRLPHGMIPLLVYLYLTKKNSKKSVVSKSLASA